MLKTRNVAGKQYEVKSWLSRSFALAVVLCFFASTTGSPQTHERKPLSSACAKRLKSLAGFYDEHTGRFLYTPPTLRTLLKEDGSASVHAIRIAVPGGDGEDGLSFDALPLVADYGRALRDIEGLRLWISAAPDRLNAVHKLIASWPRSTRNRVEVFPASGWLNHWTQDSGKPMTGGRLLLTANTTKYGGHAATLLPLEKAGKITTEAAVLPLLAGGDIVVGDRHIFVGTPTVEKLMKATPLAKSEAVAALTAELGGTVFEVGAPEETQGAMKAVAFHADLTLAAARNQRDNSEVILLDSPRMLLEDVLKVPRLEELNHQTFRESTAKAAAWFCQQHRIGSKVVLNIEERRFLRHLLALSFSDALDRAKKMDVLKQRLIDADYANVLELPGFTKLDPTKDRAAVYNYTNSVFLKDFVLAPKVGIRLLDGSAYAIFRELGYRDSDGFRCPVFS